MKSATKTRLLWGSFLAVVLVFLGAMLCQYYAADNIQYADGSVPEAGPIECRLILREPADSLARARAALRPGSLGTGRILPRRNPLVMDDHLAYAEVRNTSQSEFAVFCITDSFDPARPARSFGEVRNVIMDASGNQVLFFNPITRSLRTLWTIDEKTGQNVPCHLHPITQRPIIKLAPGQVLTSEFSLIGDKNYETPRPGVYLIRAVFSYYEAPGGTCHQVASNALSVRVTERHLDQWMHLDRPCWEVGLSF